MRIIGRLKWDTSVRLTSYTDWPKKRVCVLLKIASPFPPRRFAFRFSPMVFLYLSTVIPSIWFLELSLLQYKLPVNISSGPELEELLAHIPISAVENWAAGLEQTMLIVLVLGRWLMPKGDMSRDQLSQLLMVYVGLGADILDIFDTFKEPEVKTNRAVIIMGLALFSWALMQFPLVLTQTSPPKAHLHLLLTVGLQDGPFLIYRLYLMIRENVLNQLMIFFTCKNILVVLLEFYRIFVVQCEQQGEGCLGGLERCAVPWCQQAQEEESNKPQLSSTRFTILTIFTVVVYGLYLTISII
uniref:Transmembrane protein 26a n=1 Tax=Salmo trutta TaxID=8032 RepID=A0A674EM54_SALTR